MIVDDSNKSAEETVSDESSEMDCEEWPLELSEEQKVLIV